MVSSELHICFSFTFLSICLFSMYEHHHMYFNPYVDGILSLFKDWSLEWLLEKKIGYQFFQSNLKFECFSHQNSALICHILLLLYLLFALPIRTVILSAPKLLRGLKILNQMRYFTLKGKGAWKFHRCLWSKGATKVRRSTKAYKTFLINNTHCMEICTLVLNLLIEAQDRGRVKGKREREMD